MVCLANLFKLVYFDHILWLLLFLIIDHMIICVCKKLKESNNWDSIQKNEWFQPKSQQSRERERERECEHERKNVFETHPKLLKFAKARIESASVGENWQQERMTFWRIMCLQLQPWSSTQDNPTTGRNSPWSYCQRHFYPKMKWKISICFQI